MSVRWEPNRNCMRGLHLHFFTTPALDPSAVADELEVAFAHKLIRGEEQWGSQTMIRLILQFVVEFRLGEREGQISLIHRVTADTEARERSHETLRALLERLVAAA